MKGGQRVCSDHQKDGGTLPKRIPLRGEKPIGTWANLSEYLLGCNVLRTQEVPIYAKCLIRQRRGRRAGNANICRGYRERERERERALESGVRSGRDGKKQQQQSCLEQLQGKKTFAGSTRRKGRRIARVSALLPSLASAFHRAPQISSYEDTDLLQTTERFH